MIYITGDTHGELDRFKEKQLRRLGKNDVLFVLGDFGFLWDGGKEEKKRLDWLARRPYTILFLDGTHENYDRLDACRWRKSSAAGCSRWAATSTTSAGAASWNWRG